jgi:hypothetical protein
MTPRPAVLVGFLLLAAAPAFAQQDRGFDRQIDVDRLPIDIQRIQRQVRQAAADREQHDGLNLRYQVEVFGRAPELKLFTPEDNLTTGPVPYGAPTHQQMIDHVTPREFSSPVMDFNALFRWLAEKAKQ